MRLVTRSWTGTARGIRRVASRECGSALIELALCLSLLGLPLLLGTIYTGTLVFDRIQIANAAHAGALYGMQGSGQAADTTGIVAAAQAEAPSLGSDLVITPVVFYACSIAIDGTQYSSQSAANTACTGNGNHALQFVKVTASYAATPFAQIPGLQRTVTLTGVSVMEVEE